MDPRDDTCDARSSCCGSGPSDCVFAKAVLARQAVCELSQRHAVAERDVVVCPSPVAQANCRTLAGLLRERATFALKLPGRGQPLVHAKALQLQCGGVLALQRALQAEQPDVHRLVGLAHERWGSLMDAPWGDIVADLSSWQPRRRHRSAP